MSTTKCPYCAEEIQVEAVKCKHCGTWLSDPSAAAPASYQSAVGTSPPARLTRSSTDRLISGLCGGLARYVGVDPTLVRVVVALVAFFTAIFPGLILYTILTIVIPRDDALVY